jgi:heptosyltransferase-3
MKQPVRSILLVKLRAIGDTLLTLPSIQAIHEGFPQAALDVMCPAASAELLRYDGRIRDVIPYERAWFKSLDHHVAVFSGLQRKNYDLAICLHASFRTALIGWMSGAPWRSVRNHSGPDWFCNAPSSERKEPKSIVQRDFDALRALGLNPVRELPEMRLAPWAQAEAESFWKKHNLSKSRVVALAPSAGKQDKRWPMERWHELARLIQRHGRRALWVVAPQEPLALPQDLARGAVVARFESLQALAAALKLAGSLVGNDSAPRHLCAAVGGRTLTLFGPETMREWHPYRKEEGHHALKSATGRMDGLPLQAVEEEVRAWLR